MDEVFEETSFLFKKQPNGGIGFLGWDSSIFHSRDDRLSSPFLQKVFHTTFCNIYSTWPTLLFVMTRPLCHLFKWVTSNLSNWTEKTKNCVTTAKTPFQPGSFSTSSFRSFFKSFIPFITIFSFLTKLVTLLELHALYSLLT